MNRKIVRVGLITEIRNDDFVPGSPGKRLSLVWPLTQEVASLSRYHDVERRLQRNIAIISRRKR